MVLSSGIDNLTPDVDLNEIYAANINVAYKVMGNSAKNYPTTDKGLLIVTEIDNVILQTYITKKRVYRRYGEIKSYTVYDDSQMQQEIPPKEGEVGADSPVPPVGTIVTSATFTNWIYEIYGLTKDIATETDYGLITETRIKDLIRTYAPAYDPTAMWALVNSKASKIDLDGKVNKTGDTFYNEHTFDNLDTLNGNFHLGSSGTGGSYAFYRRSPDNSRWQYLMGLNGAGGIDASIGGGDHAEMHNLSSGVRSYIKSYNNGEGDVAYIEDLQWKWLYDSQGEMRTFTISGGNIPSQANEILVEFWVLLGLKSPQQYQQYHESNFHSIPLRYGGGYNIYRWGTCNIFINQDGIYNNVQEGRTACLTAGVTPEIGGTIPDIKETISPTYIRRVLWR